MIYGIIPLNLPCGQRAILVSAVKSFGLQQISNHGNLFQDIMLP